MNTPFHIEVPANTAGRDFVTGDIHGMLEPLDEFFRRENFDFEKDRLFCVGDLVDRGPNSEDIVNLIGSPWFFSVRGNHEQMTIDAHRLDSINARGMHIMNGGEWFGRIHDMDRREEIVQKLETLPFAITINRPNGDKIGVIHADVFGSWDDVIERCRKREESPRWTWGRDRITKKNTERVTGVRVVYTGHSVVPMPGFLGNVAFIDTGSCFPDGYQSFFLLNENYPDYFLEEERRVRSHD